jgi:RNA polymerase primary sigma factor
MLPPPSREEELALVARAKTGDRESKDLLVRHHLAFVVAIVLKHRLGHHSPDDLVQEGCLGVLHAAEKFNLRSGNRFLTYAQWWIRAYVGRYLSRSRSIVRPKWHENASEDVSLDEPLFEGTDTTHLDLVPCEKATIDEVYERSDFGRHVRQRLDAVRPALGDIGWDVVHSRLLTGNEVSLQTIGSRWGVTREWTRQQQLRAEALLRSVFEEEAA